MFTIGSEWVPLSLSMFVVPILPLPRFVGQFAQHFLVFFLPCQLSAHKNSGFDYVGEDLVPCQQKRKREESKERTE